MYQFREYGGGILYFFSTPRSATFQPLQTSANPILVGALWYSGWSVCPNAETTYLLTTYLVKFKHGEPDKYTTVLDISYTMNNVMYLSFLQSTTAPPSMELSGTDNSYIGVATVWLHM